MPVTVQVLYPTTGDTTFDHAYYQTTHDELLREHLGTHMVGTTVTKMTDDVAPFHAIATLVFADAVARDAALAIAGPVIADIANFTNAQPLMLMGEVTG